MKQKIIDLYHKYGCIFFLAIILMWVKTIISYHIDFNLGVNGWFQQFILFINPLSGIVFLLSLSLFARNVNKGHKILFALCLLNSMLLYTNVLYYREFTDFLTLSTMFQSTSIFAGFGNLIGSTFALMKWYDFIYWLDLLCLFLLLRRRNSFLVLADEKKFFTRPCGRKAMIWSLVFFLVNLGLAEISRPMLLTRTFDRNYIVKYLGISGFTVYDSIQTFQSNTVTLEESDIEKTASYISQHHAAPAEEQFGIAKDRNLIMIHMESIQQFLIDYQYTDDDGKSWEVLPFLNKLYHSKDSISFSNLYAQIGQGKSSDAELMTETSLFGLAAGTAFIRYAENTYYALPQILRCKADYTSAAFHGNTGSFWNRNNIYPGLGYDYFFDAADFSLTEENTTNYGLKDKLFFQQSVQYLEQLQQPFYAKFITLSNHHPFPVDENNPFPLANTTDDSVNGYFPSSNYADQALEEFFHYLEASGIYENSIIVLYGDHYGISGNRNKDLAPLLERDPSSWTEFDDVQMKRVPLIIHIPGYEKGFIDDEYGGQIDILPTILHLLGISTKSQILMGQDLLSPKRDEIVSLRNGDMVSPSFTCIGERTYDTHTGIQIEDSDELLSQTKVLKDKAQEQLTISDLVLETNLYERYSPKGLTLVNREDFDYSADPLRLMQAAYRAGAANTSVYYLNHRNTTILLYKTDAPEHEPNKQP
ncbi:MAG: LTA synthase family protein [Clostridia bacterium]|nr:LTA synthase family protein [Clostridia bacterium]